METVFVWLLWGLVGLFTGVLAISGLFLTFYLVYSPIYLASNLNSWNPADPASKLAPQSDGRWRIALATARMSCAGTFRCSSAWRVISMAASSSGDVTSSMPRPGR